MEDARVVGAPIAEPNQTDPEHEGHGRRPPRALRAVAVIPCLNEEGKIGTLVGRFAPGLVDTILVVDDGSTDATAAEAERAGATVLRHERNRGVGAAIRSGIDWAAQHRFDVVVVLGGDDQDDPNEIPRLLEPIERGDVEFAQGSRRLGGRRTIDMPLFRRVTTKLYSALFRLATGFPSTDGTNGFRAFRLSLLEDRAIDLHQDWLETYELEPYLFAQAIRRGHRVVEVPVTKRYDRHLGYTKMMPGRDWWRILRPLVFLRLGLRR